MKPANVKYRVLVVDDDKEMRESLSHLLSSAGFKVETLSDGTGVLRKVNTFEPHVVLSDVRMPNVDGLKLLSQLTAQVGPPVILISAHGDIAMAVEAMQTGAYSFIEKPFDPRRLLIALKNAADKYALSQDADRLKARLSRLSGLDRVLLGETQMLRDLREDVLDLSQTDATVLILGETGTGKELVARALHDLSDRSAGPFFALNCAAIGPNTFEEILFGTADGAKGAFLRADGGTLFLDEIGASPLDVQAALLRAIETREFVPRGAEQPVQVDVRLISASNVRLDAAVKEKEFREDLFFRLNNVVLNLPALRDRRNDISLLYTHFLQDYAALYEVIAPATTAEDLTALLSHDWPGNVRELRHVAERRILAARRGRGSVAEAISTDEDYGDVPDTLREAVAAFERMLIGKAIQTHQGRMESVAEALGIGRRTLNEKIAKLGLNKSDYL